MSVPSAQRSLLRAWEWGVAQLPGRASEQAGDEVCALALLMCPAQSGDRGQCDEAPEVSYLGQPGGVEKRLHSDTCFVAR